MGTSTDSRTGCSAALGLAARARGQRRLLAAAAEVQLLQQDGKPVAGGGARGLCPRRPGAAGAGAGGHGSARPALRAARAAGPDRRAVTFPNSDNVSHHVYSFSPPRRFQLYLAKGGPPQSVVFDRAGVETLGCNMHDWMLGYILVVDTPYFAVTDDDGRARVSGLAAGAYRLEVWHPRFPDPKARYTREVRAARRGRRDLGAAARAPAAARARPEARLRRVLTAP